MTTIILFVIGMLLIILNLNAIKKEKNSFNQALRAREESMKDYEVEIGKIRKELAENILDLQREIEDLKSIKNVTKNKDSEDEIGLDTGELVKDFNLNSAIDSKENFNNNIKMTNKNYNNGYKKENNKVQNNRKNKNNTTEKNKPNINIKNDIHIRDKNSTTMKGENTTNIENKSIIDVKSIETTNIEIQSNHIETYNQAGKKVSKTKKVNGTTSVEEGSFNGKKINELETVANKKENLTKEIIDNMDKGINYLNKKDENNKNSHNSVKINEISKMLEDNLSIDEISEKIGIGKGEVLLIKELYVK